MRRANVLYTSGGEDRPGNCRSIRQVEFGGKALAAQCFWRVYFTELSSRSVQRDSSWTRMPVSVCHVAVAASAVAAG